MLKKQVVQLLDYLVKLLKKWNVWISLLPTIWSNLCFYVPSLNTWQIPQILPSLSIFVGIIWAGFEVYKDILKTIPLVKQPIKHLDISLVEGSEYRFDVIDEIAANVSINKSGKNKEYALNPNVQLPPIELTIRGRIENDGDISLVILRVNGYLDPIDPFDFSDYKVRILENDGTEVNTITIDPKEIYFFTITANVYYKSSENNLIIIEDYNPSQVAARINAIIKDKVFAKAHIYVESRKLRGNEKPEKIELLKYVGLRALCETLITYWRELGDKELLGLASEYRNLSHRTTRPTKK